jgi:hypothetical protein
MATEMASVLLDARAIEIWEGRRIVVCLKPVKPKGVSAAH